MKFFNVDKTMAKQLGVQEALIFDYVGYRIYLSKKIYKEKPWFKASYKTLQHLMPFFTQNQIETLMKKLVRLNVLEKAEVNESRFDRTYSYTVGPYGYKLFRTSTLEGEK